MGDTGSQSQINEERPKTGLASPVWIGNKKAPNGVVHQPMECNDSFGGFPSQMTLRRYRRLAQARAGITVVEGTSVVSSSRSRLHQLVADEQHRKGIDKLTNEFKRINGNTILCYQLAHSGQTSDPRFSEVVRVYEARGFDRRSGRILQTSEIRDIRESFIKAAEVVHDSGADMVDVKLCHGYLGTQIIRPANMRNDGCGGSLENRMRFAREVIQGIKERITDTNFKMMVRFSIYEGDITASGEPITGGVGTKGPESTEFCLDEPHEMLRMLAGYGVDILNISAGNNREGIGKGLTPSKLPEELDIDKPETYASYYHLDFARGVRNLNLGVPVIGSGFSLFGKNIPAVGENAILHGYVDMVGIGRQSLADPFIFNGAGDTGYCIRCYGCTELLAAQMPVGCVHCDPFYAALRDSTRLHFTAPWRKQKA